MIQCLCCVLGCSTTTYNVSSNVSANMCLPSNANCFTSNVSPVSRFDVRADISSCSFCFARALLAAFCTISYDRLITFILGNLGFHPNISSYGENPVHSSPVVFYACTCGDIYLLIFWFSTFQSKYISVIPIYIGW